MTRPVSRADGLLVVEVPPLLAGVRVDRAVAMLANVSRTVATGLIAAGGVLVDGVVVTVGRNALRRGRRPDHRPARARRRGRRGGSRRGSSRWSTPTPRGRGGQAGRPGGASGCRSPGGHPGRRAAGALSRPGRPGGRRGLPGRSAGHRAPAGQGHVGAPGGGPHRVGLRRAGGPAGRPQHGASLSGPGRGGGGGRPGRDRRPHRALHPHADQDGRRGRRAVGPHRLHRAGAPDVPRPTTLVELSLQSGRTHQIRVHMAAIGHPVVGDARYGTPETRLGPGGSSSTPSSWPSPTRRAASAWSSPPRSPPTSRRS